MPAPTRDTHEAVVSFFVMSTAAAALVLSWLQIELSRRHNQLSTQPSINIVTATNETTEEPGPEDEEGLYLENKGLGPALVKSVLYFLDKKPVVGDPAKETSPVDEIAAQLQLSKIVKFRESEELDSGDYLKENDEIKLLAAKSKNVLQRDVWVSILRNRIGIAINYCSVYDVCWTQCYNAPQVVDGKPCK